LFTLLAPKWRTVVHPLRTGIGELRFTLCRNRVESWRIGAGAPAAPAADGMPPAAFLKLGDGLLNAARSQSRLFGQGFDRGIAPTSLTVEVPVQQAERDRERTSRKGLGLHHLCIKLHAPSELDHGALAVACSLAITAGSTWPSLRHGHGVATS